MRRNSSLSQLLSAIFEQPLILKDSFAAVLLWPFIAYTLLIYSKNNNEHFLKKKNYRSGAYVDLGENSGVR